MNDDSVRSVSHLTRWQSWQFQQFPHSLRIAVWIVMPTCWFIQAASYRHNPLTDAISYLDMARGCMAGNWAALINGYWSPLYPLILSFWLTLIKPSAYREIEVVQYLNCLLLISTMFIFRYFLCCLNKFLKVLPASDSQYERLPFAVLEAIGYTLFFWMSLYMLPPSLITPDILVAALVLLIGSILLRIKTGTDQWLNYAALGLCLGLGYLAKAFMFPVSFVVIAMASFYFGNSRRAIPRLLCSFSIFLLVASPLVVSLSRDKGRFTFGDTGAINYAEFVNGVVYSHHWQGGPPGAGNPEHPTRKILDSPVIYEYGSPIGGTYPLGYDISYWYEGVRPHFELRGQLNALRHCFDSYFEIFTQLGSIATGFIAFLFLGQRFVPFLQNFLRLSFLWGPPFVALGLYSVVHVEPRFLPGFIVLIWASLFLSLRIPQRSLNVVGQIAFAIIVVLGMQIAWSVGHSVVRLMSFEPFPAWQVVGGLRANGIKAGDHVAFIGFTGLETYWAHLAGVSFVAEIPAEGTTSFVLANQETKAHVYNLFRQSGAKAVLTKSVPSEALSQEWKRLENTEYYILVLNN
jgi:hypothetical protein